METMNTFPSWFRSPPTSLKWKTEIIPQLEPFKRIQFSRSDAFNSFSSSLSIYVCHFLHDSTGFIPSMRFSDAFEGLLFLILHTLNHILHRKPTSLFSETHLLIPGRCERACMCATLKSFRVVVNETPSVLTPWVAINSSFFASLAINTSFYLTFHLKSADQAHDSRRNSEWGKIVNKQTAITAYKNVRQFLW